MPNFHKVLRKRPSNKILLFQILLILSACGSQSGNRISDQNVSLTIELGDKASEYEKTPIIDKDGVSKTIGPEPKNNFFVQKNDEVTQINTLVLSPGIYRSFAFLPILKDLKSEKIPVHYIGGFGLSSLIATYYAFGYKPDHIEWKLFKNFYGGSKNYPFDKKWLKSVLKMLEKDFAGKRIEDAKISLFIPTVRNGRISYASRGDLLKEIKINLMANQQGALNVLIGRDVCELKGGQEPLRSSKIICLNVLDSQLRWNEAKDFVMGIYNKASFLVGRNNELNKVDIDMTGIELDNISVKSEVLTRARGQSSEIIKIIKQRLKL